MPYIDDQDCEKIALLLSKSAEMLDALLTERRYTGHTEPGDKAARDADHLAGDLEAAAAELMPSQRYESEAEYSSAFAEAEHNNPISKLRVSDRVRPTNLGPIEPLRNVKDPDASNNYEYATDILNATAACQQVVLTSQETCDDLARDYGSDEQAAAGSEEYRRSMSLLMTYTGVVKRFEQKTKTLRALARMKAG